MDPSEVDRIAQLTGLPLMRLVDWKNRAGEPFELRCAAKEGGTYRLELNTPQPTVVDGAVPVVHGDYESRKDDDGTLVYKALPGNSLGQVVGNDGRPAFGAAFDLTELDAEGRPLFKVYFGSATEWFVKNVYHQRWNELRDAKNELEPPQDKPQASEPADERVGKERGRNPRDRARNEQRGGGGGGGGGRRGHGGAGEGVGQQGGGGRRRGRRGGRGRGRGGGQSGGPSGE